jgi:hypothetical protein
MIPEAANCAVCRSMAMHKRAGLESISAEFGHAERMHCQLLSMTKSISPMASTWIILSFMTRKSVGFQKLEFDNPRLTLGRHRKPETHDNRKADHLGRRIETAKRAWRLRARSKAHSRQTSSPPASGHICLTVPVETLPVSGALQASRE